MSANVAQDSLDLIVKKKMPVIPAHVGIMASVSTYLKVTTATRTSAYVLTVSLSE